MTVLELGETLRHLVALLEASDAKATTIRELNEFVNSTSSFGSLKLKEFVKLAETGRDGSTPKPPPRRVTGAKTAVSPDVISAEVVGLYERAADPSVTEEQMRAACVRVGPLKKGDQVQLCEKLGLHGMKAKKKDEIITAITNRLLERKGASIRRNLIDRPEDDAAPASLAD